VWIRVCAGLPDDVIGSRSNSVGPILDAEGHIRAEHATGRELRAGLLEAVSVADANGQVGVRVQHGPCPGQVSWWAKWIDRGSWRMRW
jgi:hypothetical protein